jgi:23S rRNA (cytosine1962-C5)-methyltransferase
MSTPSATARSPRPIVRLRANQTNRVLHGHPWIFSNEIEMSPEARALEPGALVRIERLNGGPVGVAMFNPHTLIAARMLVRGHADIDAQGIGQRIGRALAVRERLFTAPYYRLVHAEGDGLPGLIVDRYGDVLAVQANTAGMDRLLPQLLPALEQYVRPRAIALRNDSPARALEGLAQEVGWAKGTVDGAVRIEEEGVAFFADVTGGQKTGWFYDQRENRSFVASLARGLTVLDAYAHTGGFAVRCAQAGAVAVLAVDRSEHALDLAARAAAENGVAARCEFRRAEVFAELEALHAAGRQFELVIADPPAFVKSKRELEQGLRGYRKLARLAATAVAPNGMLAIASCSHNVSPADFQEQVARGIADVSRTARILRSAGAAPDHPVHPMLPETAYLKMLVLALD